MLLFSDPGSSSPWLSSRSPTAGLVPARRMFRQEVRTIGLSIEQGTSSVPDDGRFYVVVDGIVVFSSKTESAALTRYRSLRDDLLQHAGIEQRPADPEETKRRERQFYELQAIMSPSMRARTINAKRKGGKGRA
jgi:hypothetical protein